VAQAVAVYGASCAGKSQSKRYKSSSSHASHELSKRAKAETVIDKQQFIRVDSALQEGVYFNKKALER
jgi:hypothetical protein